MMRDTNTHMHTIYVFSSNTTLTLPQVNTIPAGIGKNKVFTMTIFVPKITFKPQHILDEMI